MMRAVTSVARLERTSSAFSATQQALATEDVDFHDRSAEQHARALLHAFGDRRVGVDAAIDVVERRVLIDEERDALDRARRLWTDDAKAEDLG